MAVDEAKLFRSGDCQAVRLPKGFRFSGDSVYVRRVGHGVLLLPKSDDPVEVMLRSLERFAPDFMPERSQGGQQEHA